jgi:hypothetical protein
VSRWAPSSPAGGSWVGIDEPSSDRRLRPLVADPGIGRTGQPSAVPPVNTPGRTSDPPAHRRRSRRRRPRASDPPAGCTTSSTSVMNGMTTALQNPAPSRRRRTARPATQAAVPTRKSRPPVSVRPETSDISTGRRTDQPMFPGLPPYSHPNSSGYRISARERAVSEISQRSSWSGSLMQRAKKQRRRGRPLPRAGPAGSRGPVDPTAASPSSPRVRSATPTAGPIPGPAASATTAASSSSKTRPKGPSTNRVQRHRGRAHGPAGQDLHLGPVHRPPLGAAGV